MAADFDTTFAKLREILRPYAKRMVVVHDTPENYYLDTKHTGPNGKPLMFAAVRKGKSYVSFHLFPVYMFPDLLKDLAPPLKKRMQGKSCFNFKEVDEEQIEALRELTERGYERGKQFLGKGSRSFEGVGLTGAPRKRRNLDEIAGTWKADKDFDATLAAQDQVTGRAAVSAAGSRASRPPAAGRRRASRRDAGAPSDRLKPGDSV